MTKVTSRIFSVEASQLGFAFGGAAISGDEGGYGFGDISEENSLRLLDEAFERGVRVFDSAPIYGFGQSEKRMGKAFRKKREKVYLVSKCGVTWHQNRRVDMNNDPKICRNMLEQSLRDFQSDYIDLYMLHWPDSKVDVRHSMEVLFKAKEEGKIHEIGLCNTNQKEYELASELGPIDVLQGEWSPLQQQNLEIKSFCHEENLAWMSWGSLDKGILTGRVTSERKFLDKSDCRSWAPWWKAMKKEDKYAKVQFWAEELKKYDFSLIDFAVAFQKRTKTSTMPIFGFRNSEQLAGIYESWHKDFPEDLMESLIKEN